MIAAIAYRWLAVAALGAALFGAGMLKGCSIEQQKHARAEAQTAALAEAQANRTREREAQQRNNLKEVTHELRQDIRAAADVAVANYRRRHPGGVCHAGASGSGVPQPAASDRGDDGAGGEWLVARPQPDDGFIRACARDAARLNAWIRYCTLNKCPVEPGG